MGDTSPASSAADSPLLDEREQAMLHWRSRRGMVENDIFIAQFFKRFKDQLTQRHASGMNQLMSLSDNDLLDLLLRRKEPEGDMNIEEVREVLGMLRVGI